MINSLYDKFKHWSKNGAVYIISDTHFDDDDCKLMNPNWIDSEEQVNRINKLVSKNDTLIVLGDVGNRKWIPKLKAGYKVLITGNHDAGVLNYLRNKNAGKSRKIRDDLYGEECALYNEVRSKYPYTNTIDIKLGSNYLFAKYDNCLFDEVYTGPLFISNKILLSHEPIYGLDFCYNIHGHVHSGEMYEDNYHLNLARDVCDYTPINLGILIKSGRLSGITDIHRQTIDKARNKDEQN